MWSKGMVPDSIGRMSWPKSRGTILSGIPMIRMDARITVSLSPCIFATQGVMVKTPVSGMVFTIGSHNIPRSLMALRMFAA